MASIRRRLTLWYVVALAVSIAAFGGALYFERRRSSLRELDERLALEGSLAAQYFINFQRQLGRTLATGETPTLKCGLPLSSRSPTHPRWTTAPNRSSPP